MLEKQNCSGGGKALLPRAGIGIAVALIPVMLLASEPSWWNERGVKIPGATPSDYSAINLGQAKHFAVAAVAEFDQQLPDGAGDVLHALIQPWTSGTTQPKDYAAITLGQLKAILKPFYLKLFDAGYAVPSQFPWTSATSANAGNYAMANIGQAKHLFSFDPALANNNPLPAQWRLDNFGYLWVDPNGIDPTTGLTYLTEYLEGRLPRKGAIPDTDKTLRLLVYTPLR